MEGMTLAQRLRTAHADTWQQLGLIHTATGGSTFLMPGSRLMASGLPLLQYNNMHVVDSTLLDLPAVRKWYAERRVPWGALVAADMPWTAGRKLFRMRLLGLLPKEFFLAVAGDSKVKIRQATPGDLEDVLRIDCAAFQGEPEQTRLWLAPLLHNHRVTIALASLDDDLVGTAYTVRTDGVAGPAACLAGVGVMPEARRRGVARMLSSWLVQRAIEKGAELVHCHPDTEEASRVYESLGFYESAAFDVWVDIG